MSTELAIPQKFSELSEELNKSVLSVINSESLVGFEKAYTIAIAAQKLNDALTPEYMKPIMALQGNRLGFKADKIYDEKTVKNCLIEAVLMGLQPFGNEFNIIAGNAYATKEGIGSLLKKFPGLSYEIIPQLPRIKDTSGAVVMKISWMLNGSKQEREIDFAIKVNQYMGADAVIGKATRKARKWLHDTISGFEIPEGDVTDVDTKGSVQLQKIEIQDLEMLFEFKKDSLTADELASAKRIIENKEEKSYTSLHKILSEK